MKTEDIAEVIAKQLYMGRVCDTCTVALGPSSSVEVSIRLDKGLVVWAFVNDEADAEWAQEIRTLAVSYAEDLWIDENFDAFEARKQAEELMSWRPSF